MIILLRTTEISEGKMFEAIAYAKEMTTYMNDNFDTNLRILTNIGGKVNQIHFLNEYESHADIEDLRAKFIADSTAMELMEKSQEAGLFVGSSIVDNLYRTVD